MHNILLLGSKSHSRQHLLRAMDIPFQVVDQHADESACDISLPFPLLIASIAQHKMDHVLLTPGVQGQTCFVLTADTMGQDIDGVVHGKPKDTADAIAKINSLRRGGIIGTAFCLDKKRFDAGAWVIEHRIQEYVETQYVFEIPDHWIERYLQHVPRYLDISGALIVEDFGTQFLKSINGSYSAAQGLPVFELRNALERIEFL